MSDINKIKKDAVINIRVSSREKEELQSNAEKMGMKLGTYMKHASKHHTTVVIDKGREIASELFRLNKRLSQYDNFPILPIKELRDIIGESIIRLNEIQKGDNQDVNTKV